MFDIIQNKISKIIEDEKLNIEFDGDNYDEESKTSSFLFWQTAEYEIEDIIDEIYLIASTIAKTYTYAKIEISTDQEPEQGIVFCSYYFKMSIRVF